jgi:hypothetical protein
MHGNEKGTLDIFHDQLFAILPTRSAEGERPTTTEGEWLETSCKLRADNDCMKA